MQGDTAKARTAYQDFFALWKDADPDVPLLRTAKAEYEKLSSAEQAKANSFASRSERQNCRAICALGEGLKRLESNASLGSSHIV
jgi:hypothetical protein